MVARKLLMTAPRISLWNIYNFLRNAFRKKKHKQNIRSRGMQSCLPDVYCSLFHSKWIFSSTWMLVFNDYWTQHTTLLGWGGGTKLKAASGLGDFKAVPMSRAVHGFQSKDLFLHFKGKHVVTVMLPVPWSHPELAVVDIWRDNFLEASFSIFTLEEEENSKSETHQKRFKEPD